MSNYNGHILPPELLQAILLQLDFESFCLASVTCTLWQSAAMSMHILREQLRIVPALARTSLQEMTPQEIRYMFRRVCRANLIGMRNRIETRILDSKDLSTPRIGDIHIRSRHGRRFARLRGMALSLDISPGLSKCREIQLSPAIFPAPDAVKQLISHGHSRAFFSARSFARPQVALSDSGDLLAVALGQKIHVYLLQRGKQSQYVEVNVSDCLLDSIQILQFAEDDELIRCEVDGVDGSYVRYLGYPKCSCYGDIRETGPAATGTRKLRYWRKALRHVYLDSRDIEQGLGGGVSLRGIRVVNYPRKQGETCICHQKKLFFGLFRRGFCDNVYAVGCISNDGAVGIIQEIPSRRITSLDSHLQTEKLQQPGNPAVRLDRWDGANLPLAHCYDPLLGVSNDGKMLAIFEQPQGQSQGAIYICSVETGGLGGDGPWPFVLSTLDHDLDSLHVTLDSTAGGYVVDAHSQKAVMQWRLPL
ncbi:hypothetical protein BDW62DRAFT_218673 [Aspergillus aurantiobrunneus]